MAGFLQGLTELIESGVKKAAPAIQGGAKSAAETGKGGLDAALKTGVAFLNTPAFTESARTIGSVIDNSPVLRGARESFFPKLTHTNIDAGERIGLSGKWIGAAAISAPVIAGGTAASNTFMPQPSPPPSAYYDGNGDLRHVNDQGAGPGFARSVMGR